MSGIAVIAPPKENENTLVQEIPLDRIEAPGRTGAMTPSGVQYSPFIRYAVFGSASR
ncbi:MAG: hypothetical protein ACRD2P_10445 [Terriglobia bacterium]